MQEPYARTKPPVDGYHRSFDQSLSKAGNVTVQHNIMKVARKIKAAGFKAFNIPEKLTILDTTVANTVLSHAAYNEWLHIDIVTRRLRHTEHQMGCVKLQNRVQLILIKINQQSVERSFHDVFRIPEDTVLNVSFRPPTHNTEETMTKVKVIPNYLRISTGRARTICMIIDKRIP